jgi:hypothetical protein
MLLFPSGGAKWPDKDVVPPQKPVERGDVNDCALDGLLRRDRF